MTEVLRKRQCLINSQFGGTLNVAQLYFKQQIKTLTANKTSRLVEERTMVDLPLSYLMDTSPPFSGLEEGNAIMSSSSDM